MSDIEKYEKGKIKFSAMTGSFRIATKLYLYNYGHLNCRKQIVFQLYEIPIDVLKELIMEIEDIKQCYETFDDYHKAYRKSTPYREYNDHWPIFLDTNFSCVIEDGWTRFHNYVDDGMQVVSALALL